MTTRKRITFAVATVSVATVFGLFVLLYRNPFDPLDAGREPVSGQYVGQTKEAIVTRFGKPSHEWEGHYGDPALEYAQVHSPAATMTYVRLTGVLYLSFKEIKGAWVCFASDWMPNGWMF